MKQRDIRFAPQAEEDLGWIYDVIAQGGGPMRAFDDTERLRSFCERLQHGAERGSMHDDIRAGLRIIGFERRVTVAFAVEADRVTILRLFYGGRNWEGDFEPS